MAVGDPHVFPGFLTPVLTQLFYPKPPATFLTCFCRGERRKYTGKKSRLNRGSNPQPPGYESNMLTTEPPWRVLFLCINPLPDMPILGFSNSAVNKDMMSKILKMWIQFSD